MNTEIRKIEFAIGKSSFKLFCGRYPKDVAELEKYCEICRQEMHHSFYVVGMKVGKAVREGRPL